MGIKVSRILHAGYVLESQGVQIAFDPLFENPFSRNCHAFPNVSFDYKRIEQERFAAVFISHFHDDHCSLESLNHLDREIPIYMYCLFDEYFSLLKELGFQNVHSLQLNEPVFIGPFVVTPRRALDEDVDSIFHVKAENLNILNVVDSWIDYETLDLLKKTSWDLVLWPFQTMREIEVLSPAQAEPASRELPPEWIEQIQELNPKAIVPSSCQFRMEEWSWYNKAFFPITYIQFEKDISTVLPNTKVVRLNPSMSVYLQQDSIMPAPSLDWVHPVGEQNVDYEYDDTLIPPATSEIAKHFAALTDEQTESVLRYCRKGLLEKYNAMEPPQDAYFEVPRIWKLVLYDHRGTPMSFEYRISLEGIKIADTKSEPIGWLTEVSIAKLYAALELGESLTSMYVRINDNIPTQSVDIMEDPLLRCLFNGAVASYQKAQLKKIQSRA
ncbi:MBL fold metallo-hydrolase [Bdellovibrio sp. 22V]|uniref:MBL fold metallo-hydrolase n=1 Tax=Bdellovibrio sp. 22V TaxID=3044166 RepID=UPI002542ACD2|nr:MBL fold metallo-hydrolase [Bdellovibrio sp. 22V]WII72619.1 MBL fold metallo-hydrolase [Bdellovibrio sp. 22V]